MERVKDFYDEIIGFMRNFFSGAFKDNKNISYGFLTGILRIAQESIFSGLNNLTVNSIMDEEYDSFFGFTCSEVHEMVNYYEITHHETELKEWYDGYLFGNKEIDQSTEEWLEYLHKKLKYVKWYFGHFHADRSYATMEILYYEIKELGAEDFLQRVGRPKYRMGEEVLFHFDNGKEKEEFGRYGRIAAVDAYGTLGQPKEVSYDIEIEDGSWYKYICESDIESLYD